MNDPEPPDEDRATHAAAARARKRAEAERIGIDAGYISAFVERFYARIRADDLLGPIFAERITDWPAHLERMKSFWRSILHNSGEFSGNPMIKHIAIAGIGSAHFAHWLELFYETLGALEADVAAGDPEETVPLAEATRLVGVRARMIADSLLTGIEMQRSGLDGARAGKDLPHVAA